MQAKLICDLLFSDLFVQVSPDSSDHDTILIAWQLGLVDRYTMPALPCASCFKFSVISPDYRDRIKESYPGYDVSGGYGWQKLEEGVQEKVIGFFLNDQYHPAGGCPAVGLIAQVMAPFSQFIRWTPYRSFQVRLCELLQA